MEYYKTRWVKDKAFAAFPSQIGLAKKLLCWRGGMVFGMKNAGCFYVCTLEVRGFLWYNLQINLIANFHGQIAPTFQENHRVPKEI